MKSMMTKAKRPTFHGPKLRYVPRGYNVVVMQINGRVAYSLVLDSVSRPRRARKETK